MAEIKKKFDWKITAKKVGIEAVKIFIIGFLAFAQNDARFLALVPIVKGIENVLKNYN